MIFVPLRRDFDPRGMPALLIGSLLGTPLGVWVLAMLPASTLTRLIGVVLLVVVALEWLGVYPERLAGRGWALGAGLAAGLLGAAVGTPGPPVVLYMASQGWSPRTIKAGTYMLRRNSGYTSTLDAIRGGKGLVHTVTIPEGYSLSQIIPLFASKLSLSPESLSVAVRDTALLHQLSREEDRITRSQKIQQ